MKPRVRIFAGAKSSGNGSWQDKEPSTASDRPGDRIFKRRPRPGGVILADWDTMHAMGYVHRQVVVEHADIPELVQFLMETYNSGRQCLRDWDAETRRLAEEEK